MRAQQPNYAQQGYPQQPSVRPAYMPGQQAPQQYAYQQQQQQQPQQVHVKQELQMFIYCSTCMLISYFIIAYKNLVQVIKISVVYDVVQCS